MTGTPTATHIGSDDAGRSERWFGQSFPRKEDHRLVTGDGRYVADIVLPGTLEVAFVRSPVAHANIRSIDATAALALDGVRAVVTARDIDGRVAPFTRFVDQEHTPPGLAQAVDPQVLPCPIEVLADDRVRYVGQAVVAVVADDRYIAEDAAEAVIVDYEQLPVLVDVEAACADDAIRLHDGIERNVQAQFAVNVGDVDAAFAAAGHRLSLRVVTPRVSGHPMETRGVLAAPDQLTGDLTVWSSTQVPYMVRTRIAEQLGVAEQRVRVVAPDVGGGFGPKVQVYPEEVLLPFIALQLRRPVRWIEDRREHLLSTAHARDQVHFVDVAFDDDGVITALNDRFLLDCGAYNPFSITCAYNTAAHMRSLFKIPHYRIRGECVLTNKTFNVPYRGAGRPEGAFAMDRAVYEVARSLSLRPVDVLRRNLIEGDEMPYRRGMPYRDGAEIIYDCGDFPAAFEQLLELVDYEEHKRAQVELRARGIYRGIGFGTYIEGTGIGPFESASLTLNSDGRLEVHAGCTPHGQSHDTTMSQIAADVFGVRPDQITFRAGDTGLLPYGTGTFASRSAVTAGSAVLNSAERLKQRLLNLAGELLEASPDDLEMADGTVSVKGVPDQSVSFIELYQAARPGPGARLPEGADPGTSDSFFWTPPTVTFGAGLQAAVVDVDVETGFVDVKKLSIVHDCGKLINPLVVEGQIQGGIVQGLGAAIYERIVHDEQGQPLTTTLMDYLLPTSAEIPEIDQVHLDSVSRRNALGIRGVGEAGTIAPPAAIANAVIDALEGFCEPELFELPLTPALVLNAIETARKKNPAHEFRTEE